jgi:hypothetical protein
VRPVRYAIDVLREASAYPLRGVLGLIVITSVEAMILYTIIRPRTYDRSWKRTGTALLLCLPWLLVCLETLMHQPPYVLLHFVWVLAGDAGFSGYVCLCDGSNVGRREIELRLAIDACSRSRGGSSNADETECHGFTSMRSALRQAIQEFAEHVKSGACLKVLTLLPRNAKFRKIDFGILQR